jgi:hypothetical protein
MLKITKKQRDQSKRLGEMTSAEPDDELKEHLTLLNAEDRSAVDRLTREVDSKIIEASKETVKEAKMIEEGHCPSCGKKTRSFLFTTVCESCGWSKFSAPKTGRTIVHMHNGSSLVCTETFYTPEEVLLVTDNVVRQRVPRQNVAFIEFDFSDEEIERRRKEVREEETIRCAWTGKAVRIGDEDTRVTFAAFGAYQERFVFIDEKAQEAFQKQYPTRIHRDCYHRDCSKCNECIKRYDDTSYETYLEEEFVH